MRTFAHLTILISMCTSILANELVDKIEPFQTGDPTWPRQCVAPNCNVVNRSLRYPATTARQFWQCQFANNAWNAVIGNCPCDHLFDYMVQSCVRFDSPRTEWCTNSINQTPIFCNPVTTTTAAPTTTSTTTTMEPTTTTTTTTTIPPTTTTPRYSTVSWGG